MISNNAVCTFDTRGTDSAWKERDGSVCTVIRPLTAEEADISDVGPMYKVQFADGLITDAFEDELFPQY